MALEIVYLPKSKYMQFKKSKKAKWRNLTYDRAVSLSDKHAKQIIDDFCVDNMYYGDDEGSTIVSKDVLTKLSIKGYTPKEMLVFLVVVGSEGIYWDHDLEDMTVTLAFGSKEERKRDEAELTYKLTLAGYKPTIINNG